MRGGARHAADSAQRLRAHPHDDDGLITRVSPAREWRAVEHWSFTLELSSEEWSAYRSVETGGSVGESTSRDRLRHDLETS